MSATVLPSSRYLIITGSPTQINIIYPIEHIDNTIVNFENPESGNYVYDVCREKTNLPLIKMNYLLTSCPVVMHMQLEHYTYSVLVMRIVQQKSTLLLKPYNTLYRYYLLNNIIVYINNIFIVILYIMCISYYTRQCIITIIIIHVIQIFYVI